MDSPRDYARTTLKARHRPLVRALGEALFSPDGEVEPARLDALPDEVDAFISPASKTLRFGLLLMLDVLRLLPLFVLGRARTFESLPRAERIRMLDALDHSKIAEFTLILVAYKTLMTILFYESEAELRAIGYPGAERHRWRRALAVASERDGANERGATGEARS